MNSKYSSKHMIDILFVLVLFALFTISTVILILFGANIYQRTVDHMDSNYNARTTVSYVTEKFRQADQYGNISIGKLGDIPALTFSEDISGITYVTYIYMYDHKLYELFTRKDIEMFPDGGLPVIEVNDFSIEQIDSQLFHISITAIDNSQYSFYLSAHSTF